MGYISPPGTRRRLRWNLKNQKSLTAMHLSLSQDTIDSVASAIPKKYGARRNQLPDAPFLDDPVLSNFSSVAVSAIQAKDFQTSTHNLRRNGLPPTCCWAHLRIRVGTNR
jgi:hypothetical protein